MIKEDTPSDPFITLHELLR